jgi:hypothetical protein
MNTFLLLLLGVAIIIIIVQASSKKKTSHTFNSSFTGEKSKETTLPTEKKVSEPPVHFLGEDEEGEYNIGFEDFTLTGVHLPGRKKYILENCKEEDDIKLTPEKDNLVNPLAIAVEHEGEIIGYIADDDLEDVHNLMKFEYESHITNKDYDGDFLNVGIEIEYIIPQKKKKPKKVKPQKNSDIGAEDFMIWKTNVIPHEYLTPRKDVEDTSSYFYAKKVCISGQLRSFPYRGELAKYLWEIGADVDTSVGKTCGILISGDGTGPSKLKKAKEQGVQIMPETELHEKLNGFKSKYI